MKNIIVQCWNNFEVRNRWSEPRSRLWATRIHAFSHYIYWVWFGACLHLPLFSLPALALVRTVCKDRSQVGSSTDSFQGSFLSGLTIGAEMTSDRKSTWESLEWRMFIYSTKQTLSGPLPTFAFHSPFLCMLCWWLPIASPWKILRASSGCRSALSLCVYGAGVWEVEGRQARNAEKFTCSWLESMIKKKLVGKYFSSFTP